VTHTQQRGALLGIPEENGLENLGVDGKLISK
jgi:hypothetical protein